MRQIAGQLASTDYLSKYDRGCQVLSATVVGMTKTIELPGVGGVVQPCTRRTFLAGAAVTLAAGALPKSYSGQAKVDDNTVFELRQYPLYGGQRDTFISLFEKISSSCRILWCACHWNFLTSTILTAPVWIPWFSDMSARQQALEEILRPQSECARHTEGSHATMVD